MSKKSEFFSGTGRRKRSVASVWLYDEKGEIMVNDSPVSEFFTGQEETLEWVKPFHAVGVSHPQSKFRATIKVHGGGKVGQAEAVRLGIARALISYNAEFKGILRSTGLVTRDSREKERKKPFLKGARARPQYSKR
ncbi:30S ribosomal protein S9 [candidate division WWE3 bacterium CG_4_9_14_0_2_um_filter_35_11]|uniref:30S ribosomal protein S9 n=1 Tax=candidate division WWE3 bacterium CG_4_9_14_0_2_um_filter_35_11 TaxID=1975077 RepID=A0A2M8EKS5_UNCKA|nr:MAG: 30S ribosomal protein S9 [candidate division WWE3 bacterium CG10_big_fil_rev_8_21_14_0_10_35_32]PJC23346.1 MAG: 30S ribosomal protein S9 [candidate division WWE3 bacterium CG_4_9_14_0_2_um_filter_35_11]